MAVAEVAVVTAWRRFSLEQKQRYLEEAERTSMTAVARRYEISRSLLQRWKDARGAATGSALDPFVRLLPSTPAGQPLSDERACAIYVHIASELVIELPATSGPEQVAALVAALRR